MIKETMPKTEKQIGKSDLIDFSYSINTAGGGGNIQELQSLIGEISGQAIPLVCLEDLSPTNTVVSVARLGSPGAKADQFAQQAATAPVKAIEALCQKTNLPFPKAIAPVEATAGQMARAIRSLLAAQKQRPNLALLDADICGGSAVPAVPLAAKIQTSLKACPQLAVATLIIKKGVVVPQVKLISEPNPFVLEDKLRIQASQAEMGAVWFAWLLTPVNQAADVYIPGAISNSIKRGRLLRQEKAPLQALLEKGEIIKIIAQGKIINIINESDKAPGFAQFSYQISAANGQIITVAARNEYIVVYNEQKKVLAAAPYIINFVGKKGPIQSHLAKPGDQVAIIAALPQHLINNPNSLPQCVQTWQQYFKKEQEKNTWPHPYQFVNLT